METPFSTDIWSDWASHPATTDALVRLRRHLHAHPELSFCEHHTASVAHQALVDAGLEPRRYAGTGVIAVLDGAKKGRTVLLRADMDALPIQEESECDYRSTRDGVMHACGHDAHVSILCAVATMLAGRREELCGRFVFVFQPAEEATGGALSMIDAGLLDEVRPDVCAGLHVWSELPTGTIACTPGAIMASTDVLEITLKGRGGHGAMPHLSRDPVVAASHLVLALQSVVARVVDPEQAAVLTIGSIKAGEAPNVIPDAATLRGTLRTYDAQVRAIAVAEIERIARGVAEAFAMSVEVIVENITLPTVNHPAWAEVLGGLVDRRPFLRRAPAGYRTMAGEDFSYFLDRVPGVFFFVGARNEALGACYPHHHPRFNIDEGALPIGASLLAEFACAAADPTVLSLQGS